MGAAFLIGILAHNSSDENPFQPASSVFASVPPALEPAGGSEPKAPVKAGLQVRDTEFSGQDVSGGGFVSLTTWAGKPIVLVLWSSTCAGCDSTFASTIQTEVKLEPGIQFVGIASGESSTSGASFVRTSNWAFPSITDPHDTLQHALGASTLPVVAILDAQHKVSSSLRGPISRDALDGAIGAVLSGE